MPDDSNVVGAPLPQDQAEYRAMLAGFGEDKVVTVFNPLSQDFRFQHARSITQAAPMSEEQRKVQDKLGFPIGKESNTMTHYSQYWVLKAGESKNLPGDIAQKAVQDLVNYILMSRAGKGRPKNVADGFARSQVEKEVVIAVHDNVSFFNSMSPQEYTDQQVNKLNGAPAATPPAEEQPDPAPGQGANFEPNRPSAKAPKAA